MYNGILVRRRRSLRKEVAERDMGWNGLQCWLEGQGSTEPTEREDTLLGHCMTQSKELCKAQSSPGKFGCCRLKTGRQRTGWVSAVVGDTPDIAAGTEELRMSFSRLLPTTSELIVGLLWT